ncbi:hypothetical protein [Staphylococcus aureus]|uniref:hypothetical protein n=1 Tax=Staphylococcus aureus TaxID=1280 RepID=UPI002269C4FB|nr:hypothetical protein [Staphylococcus aureus]WAA05887.1 hypothetical protein M1F51_13855 [Staphylococcus aureus]HCQ3446296.1 hypothetical protein [Staphylococcus aureus]HDF6658999.1 hypothetical protein [Staphylococcus aureus]
MKKAMLLGASLLGSAVILTGCGNAQDKAQGKWTQKQKLTEYANTSTNITIKDDNLVIDSKGVELPAIKIQEPKDNTFKFSIDGEKKREEFKATIDTENDKLKITQDGEKGADVFKKVKD